MSKRLQQLRDMEDPYIEDRQVVSMDRQQQLRALSARVGIRKLKNRIATEQRTVRKLQLTPIFENIVFYLASELELLSNWIDLNGRTLGPLLEYVKSRHDIGSVYFISETLDLCNQIYDGTETISKTTAGVKRWFSDELFNFRSYVIEIYELVFLKYARLTIDDLKTI